MGLNIVILPRLGVTQFRMNDGLQVYTAITKHAQGYYRNAAVRQILN